MTPSKGNAAFWGDGISWASSQDIKSARLSRTTHSITQRALDETRLMVCPIGSVLIVVRSGILAHTLPVTVTDIPVVINQDLKAFDSGDRVLNEWLAAWLRASEREILGENRRDGTTVQSVQYSLLKERLLPVPPRDEQLKILARLGEVEARRASSASRLGTARAIVDRLRAAVLAAACSGRLTADWRADDSHEGLPTSWSRVPLGDLVASIRGGSTEVPSDEPTRFPILRSSSVRAFTVDYADVRYLSAEQSRRADNFIANGDLLVTRLSGSLEFVCNAARVQAVDELSVQYPDRLFRLRLADARHAEYLEIFMASQEARSQVTAATRSAAGHQRISISDLRTFEVNLPPLAEQLEIVRRVRAALESADRVENGISVAAGALETGTRAALRKAFRRELIPAGTELVTA
jgi:type I restriction enzyme S subunit